MLNKNYISVSILAFCTFLLVAVGFFIQFRNAQLINVCLNNKWGYVNLKNETIIPFFFDTPSEFKNGYAFVCINQRCGYINKKGEIKVPFDYIDGAPFSEGLAAVRLKNEKWAFVNRIGQLKFNHQFCLAQSFHGGMAQICTEPTKCGFLNKKGVIVVPPIYEAVSDYKWGVAAVLIRGKWGFINKKGKTVIPFKYNWTGFVF